MPYFEARALHTYILRFGYRVRFLRKQFIGGQAVACVSAEDVRHPTIAGGSVDKLVVLKRLYYE
jgi:hypothetical protein